MTDFDIDVHPRLQASTLTHPTTLVRSEPFNFLVSSNMLPRNAMQTLLAAFPKLKGAGYLPYQRADCGTSINALIDSILEPEFADTLGARLGIEQMSQYPTYVSISGRLKKRHGNIHTDGKSKIATALLYLNGDWTQVQQGCLRFLNRIDDFEDMVVPEIPPVYGTLAAFRRADNSFHGHLPFEGERRVIQVAWLTDSEHKSRKAKRGQLAHRLKQLQAWLGDKLRGK
ncbi:2OG-Fe(II) oxygenase [Microbulbifer bruguierae]|uniref:2OG-Fe(II) oxygenase n=1 Tax=Microbulbifer bruguierae TaxID=3029061 RepID=A0ABY8NES0_9GAMM|nr:2OG-Fe(II) oxygenase [Microbulbifer bruguierae]WGL17429.1 2OG-Fe(II) oxygenase [Microbulbifer bruguierae]